MFPASYFAPVYFPPTYFPEVGENPPTPTFVASMGGGINENGNVGNVGFGQGGAG